MAEVSTNTHTAAWVAVRSSADRPGGTLAPARIPRGGYLFLLQFYSFRQRRRAFWRGSDSVGLLRGGPVELGWGALTWGDLVRGGVMNATAGFCRFCLADGSGWVQGNFPAAAWRVARVSSAQPSDTDSAPLNAGLSIRWNRRWQIPAMALNQGNVIRSLFLSARTLP